MREYYYRVAEFVFRVVVPETWNMERLLPSFQSFVWDKNDTDRILFTLYANTKSLPEWPEKEESMGNSDNDLGHLELAKSDVGYKVVLSYDERDRHRLICDADFKQNIAEINTKDAYGDMVLNSMLRIIFAQSVLAHKAISLHASCVWKDNQAYLFMGKSGTGKSTHSQLWIKHLENVELLNDDNPCVRLEDGEITVYGTPWSGKTPCYRNLQFPVAAMVRLSQAPHNRYIHVRETEAFMALLPSCSVVQGDARLQGYLYDTLIEMVELVKVGWLECLPDAEAAQICFVQTQS